MSEAVVWGWKKEEDTTTTTRMKVSRLQDQEVVGKREILLVGKLE